MHWMISDRLWTLNAQTYPIYTKYISPRSKFCSFGSTTSHFIDGRISKIQNAPKLLKIRKIGNVLEGQKYPVYAKYLPPRPNFWSISLYAHPVSRYKVVENQKKIGNAPNDFSDFKNLTVKRTTLYALNTYSKGPTFIRFALRQAVSRYKVLENGKCTKWPQTRVIVPYIHWILIPEAQIFIRLPLWPAVYEIQGWWKLEMHRMTSDWY